MIDVKDFIGRKYGRMTVLEEAHRDDVPGVHVLCQCECGNKKVVKLHNLRYGSTQSCGCYNKERLKEKETPKLFGEANPKAKPIEYYEVFPVQRTQFKTICKRRGLEFSDFNEIFSGIKTDNNQSRYFYVKKDKGEQI